MKKKTLIISGIALIVIVAAIIFFTRNKNGELRINTHAVQEETIEITVTATGYVQPVDKVDVGTQVSGVIEKIYADFNTQVKKGQLLAELDKSTLNEKLTQAQASLVSSESTLTFAEQNYNRTKQLYDAKAATQASYEDAVNQLAQAKTSVANAKANLHQSKVNLSYAEIYSPIDGVVLDRSVEEGQTVAASFSTPTLFTIANDLKNMQVEADVDEADIGQVRDGQPVIFNVDAYPDDIFTGTVKQIRLQPVVTSNVVTYTVIIEAPNPDEKLYPGMTANITITTRSEKGVVVPNEAMNFQPDPKDMQKLDIQLPTPYDNQVEFKNGEKMVWVKLLDKIEPRKITTGINEGVQTIVESGLKVGDEVVLSITMENKGTQTNGAASNPLMPRPPGRK